MISMTTDKEQENRQYISQDCYVIPAQRVIVNQGKVSKKIPPQPWKALNCLLKNPGRVSSYKNIKIEVWGDPVHENLKVGILIRRIKFYMREIGIDEETFNSFFQMVLGRGYRFTPQLPSAAGGKRRKGNRAKKQPDETCSTEGADSERCVEREASGADSESTAEAP